MTTFADLRTLTIELTKRPELVALTESAIRTATLRAHHTDFFRKDLAQGVLNYTVVADAYFYNFPNLTDLLPRLRTMKNVYGVTAQGHQIEQLEYRESDDLYDSDGNYRRYVYTLIGDTLRIYPDIPTGIIHVYHFTNPDVSTGGYASWIANVYPDDLAGWAAAIVMARTGFLELAKHYQDAYVKPLQEQLIASHLLATVS